MFGYSFFSALVGKIRSSMGFALAVSIYAGSIGVAVPAQAATIIYREVFPNNSSPNADESLSGEGWFIHSNNGGLATSQINSSTNGTPINATAVNSNPSVAELARGYAFNNDANGVDYLFWTNEYVVDRSVWQVTSISWHQMNESTADISRAAVQIGSQWYASTQTFNNTSSFVTGEGGQLMQLDFTTATWRLLNFIPNTQLALGGATALPAGDIGAFGWYSDSKVARLRMDTFTIEAIPVPEPSSLAMLAFGMISLWLFRRKQR